MTRPRGKPRGYVLVMTLLVLVVAAVALSSVMAESHQRAMAARTAQNELQRRWAALSCEQALLPRTAEILSNNGKPRARLVETLELGGQKLTLVLGDEQAKANVNLLAQFMEATAFRQTLNQLAGPGVAIDLAPTVTRTKDKAGKETATASFASYGQVFGETQPGKLAGSVGGRLTCWGDTKLNTKAASPLAVRAVAATVLDNPELVRFDQAQQKSPESAWQDLFRAANILPDKVKTMEGRVTDTSACTSLWVVPEDKQHFRFAVSSGGEMNVFEW
jgi:hypothetical protein